ncbi:MAG: hypothetical protein HUK40_15925 [Desulfobacter sp.]|nr:hypothetical protein [Desulfobacter sp.]
MGFSSQGQVHTQDGRMIDFSLEMSMDRAYLSKTQEQTLIHTWQEEVSFVDPLVISLDGSLPSLTDERFEFDLDNDGDLESISFVAKGSGFLSFDRNHDGKINNGSELFGPGTGNGFNELAEFDQDKNGWIDENDSVFSQLSVWTRDKDGNDQLISLKDAGIGAVYLDNAQTEFSMTTMDNQVKGEVRRSGVFLFENGNVGGIQQIDLAVRASADTNTVSPHEQGDMPGKGVDPDLGVFFSKLGLAAPGGNERETRLTELMEEIKALREEIAQILGQDTSRTRSFQGIRNQAMAFSNARIYEMIHPDPLGLKTFHSWRGRSKFCVS